MVKTRKNGTILERDSGIDFTLKKRMSGMVLTKREVVIPAKKKFYK